MSEIPWLVIVERDDEVNDPFIVGPFRSLTSAVEWKQHYELVATRLFPDEGWSWFPRRPTQMFGPREAINELIDFMLAEETPGSTPDDGVGEEEDEEGYPCPECEGAGGWGVDALDIEVCDVCDGSGQDPKELPDSMQRIGEEFV